jgi:hypothetical protein
VAVRKFVRKESDLADINTAGSSRCPDTARLRIHVVGGGVVGFCRSPTPDAAECRYGCQHLGLGGHVGKVAVLAAVTFAAYLIGAVLEFDPTRLWRSMGVPSEASLQQSFEFGGLQIKLREQMDRIQEAQADAASNTAEAGDVSQEGEESSTRDDLERIEDTRREARLLERAVELRENMSGSSGVEIMQALATKLQALSTELLADMTGSKPKRPCA